MKNPPGSVIIFPTIQPYALPNTQLNTKWERQRGSDRMQAGSQNKGKVIHGSEQIKGERKCNEIWKTSKTVIQCKMVQN